MKKMSIVLMILILSLFSRAYAKTAKIHLSQADTARLQVVQTTLSEVEVKSLAQLIQEIEKSTYPKISLAIKESMARTYADIVLEQNVVGKAKREWLYSMVALNMAYFQFGGAKDSASGATNLNKLIRSKLKMYLPADIFKQHGFHCSIG